MRMKEIALATLMALGVSAVASAQPPASERSFKDVDSNGDGRVNRHEASGIVGLDFARADTNADGSLSRPEFQAAMNTEPRDMPSARSGDAAGNLHYGRATASPSSPSSEVHEGGDEAIVRVESARGAPEESSDYESLINFDTIDKNKDGRINRYEASDIPSFDFSSADGNEDGSLSRSEFRIAMAGTQSRG